MPIVIHLREMIARYETETGQRISYAELSEKTGVGKATVYRWANNDVSLDVLASLCQFFGCQPGDLLTFKPDSLTDAPTNTP